MAIEGDQRGEQHSAGRVHRGIFAVAGRAQSAPMPVTSEHVRELAAHAGQYGDSIITNQASALDLLRSIRQFVQITAERDSPDNLVHEPLSATCDASGFGVMTYSSRVGFTDRIERCVIQNPGTGTDAYLFHQLPHGFDPAAIGVVPVAQLVDYVSSANPAAVIDQTSLPTLRNGARFTIITRGAAPGTQVQGLLVIRRSIV